MGVQAGKAKDKDVDRSAVQPDASTATEIDSSAGQAVTSTATEMPPLELVD